jgi:hypothetical protein
LSAALVIRKGQFARPDNGYFFVPSPFIGATNWKGLSNPTSIPINQSGVLRKDALLLAAVGQVLAPGPTRLPPLAA